MERLCQAITTGITISCKRGLRVMLQLVHLKTKNHKERIHYAKLIHSSNKVRISAVCFQFQLFVDNFCKNFSCLFTKKKAQDSMEDNFLLEICASTDMQIIR